MYCVNWCAIYIITHGDVMFCFADDKHARLCARTLKYFQGIAGKAWVLSVQWCIDSILQQRLLPEVSTSLPEVTSLITGREVSDH